MLLAASKADSALERALAAGEPAHVARYAFQLAQAFSNFYQKYPILHEKNREKKVFLLWMTDFFRRQLERTAGSSGDSDSGIHVRSLRCPDRARRNISRLFTSDTVPPASCRTREGYAESLNPAET